MSRLLHRLRNRTRSESGQAAFELALVLPIFVAFLLLVVEFGLVMFQFVSVNTSVREGARYGAVNCGDGSCTADEIKTRVVDRSGGIVANTGEVTVNWVDRNSDSTAYGKGDSVVVRVAHNYSFIFFPGSISIGSCSDMRLEQRDRTTTLSGGSGC